MSTLETLQIFLKKCTAKLYAFTVHDTILASASP